MYSRWYEIAVVLLWLAMMSWLVGQKVMPTMLVGHPPSSQSMLDARKLDVPICWSMAWNGRPLGWAMSTAQRQPDGSTKIRSVVHFDELPLDEMIPSLLRSVLPPLERLEEQFQMETRNVVVFSPEGRLRRFDSVVRFEPTVDAIEIRGAIEGAMLSVAVRAGSFTYETEMRMPPQAMLSDALSPQSTLPGLQQGQTWTVKLYSPLRPPTSPVEILQARVEGLEPMLWNGRPVDTWLVTYRADSGSVLGGSDRPRTRLWVDPQGTVLKQESIVLDSVMTFVRLSDREAAELAETVPDL